MTDPPRRRAADEEGWTAEQLDRLERLVGPAVGAQARYAGDVDALKDALAAHERIVREGFERVDRDSKERFDRAFLKLDRITAHVERTNGRVTDLEKTQIAEAAARTATAQALEERRKTTALHLAAHGWIRPTLVGGLVALVVTYAPKLL